MMHKSKILTSTGGPLVILPKPNADIWQGCVDFKEYEHYYLACNQSDYLSVLSIENIPAIILGDEPLPTFVLLSSSRIFIFREYYINENINLDAHLEKILLSFSDLEIIEQLTLNVNCDEWIMFDSVYSYHDNADLEYINIKFPFGNNCNITTYKYETDDVSLLFHVFQQA